MKNYLSVLSIYVRSTIYKIFAILAAMITIELADFVYRLYRNIKQYGEEMSSIAGWQDHFGVDRIEAGQVPGSFYDAASFRLMAPLEWWLDETYLPFTFAAAFVAIFAVLVWTAGERGKSRTKFFLWRLNVERKTVFAIAGGYSVFCFILLILTQILAVAGMNGVYCYLIGSEIVPQSLFMIFYKHEFLHGILPLSDWFRSIRLLCFVVTWGMTAVYIGQENFFKKYRVGLGMLLYLSAFMVVVIIVDIPILWLNLVTMGLGIAAVVHMILSALEYWEPREEV